MIILASGSPRRKEILGEFIDDFSVLVPDIDEDKIRRAFDFSFESDRLEVTQALSRAKCEKIIEQASVCEEDIVIAADTIVFLDGKDYEKPQDREDAYRMLLELAGRVHEVITGVSVFKEGIMDSFAIKTYVKFVDYSKKYEEFAKNYVEKGLSDGKAGAYGIQDEGAFFVEGIEGDYFNVVGLPIEAIRRIV